MFKNFSDAQGKQASATRGGKATQAINSYTHDELGNVEERVLATVETLGLEARPDVVAKAPANADGEPSMLADFQTPKGVKPSAGITVYREKVVARGCELS